MQFVECAHLLRWDGVHLKVASWLQACVHRAWAHPIPRDVPHHDRIHHHRSVSEPFHTERRAQDIVVVDMAQWAGQELDLVQLHGQFRHLHHRREECIVRLHELPQGAVQGAGRPNLGRHRDDVTDAQRPAAEGQDIFRLEAWIVHDTCATRSFPSHEVIAGANLLHQRKRASSVANGECPQCDSRPADCMKCVRVMRPMPHADMGEFSTQHCG
mmetsp:Transcript_51389/g.166618  ORF Transcript_51389/g.166618 Transcript_51389/m.166618 type:complete len:214 (+) Transcript_51389:389-1030(+)